MIQNPEVQEQDIVMKPQIQFIPGLEETTVPCQIKVTKSENGETGTATFLFFEPAFFSFFLTLPFSSLPQVIGMDLLWDKRKMRSKDIKIYFKEGKPRLVRSIFIFKDSKDWFNFLNFMKKYSDEAGLSFTEFKST